jgi:hypothetical protein
VKKKIKRSERIKAGAMAATKLLFLLLLFSMGLGGLVTTSAGAPKDPSASQIEKPNTPPNAPAKQPRSESSEGTSAKIVEASRIESVLGRDILSESGENVGRIVDVLADRSGQVRAAIVDLGGFLGVGSRKIAVDWSALHFGTKGSSSVVIVDLNREHLRVAPEVKQGEPVIIVGGDRPSQSEAKAPE